MSKKDIQKELQKFVDESEKGDINQGAGLLFVKQLLERISLGYYDGKDHELKEELIKAGFKDLVKQMIEGR